MYGKTKTKEFVYPWYKGGSMWKSYTLIHKGKWHISWDSLLRYDKPKFSTPKPWLWFLRFYNGKDCISINLLGFSFIRYKRNN